jgi:hypothetical protein
MTGPKQHHLPAVLISHFAAKPGKGRVRDRIVWVARRGVAAPFIASAAKVGYDRENPQLYKLSVPFAGDDLLVDRQWSGQEGGRSHLVQTFEQFAGGEFPAKEFLLGAVPLVAQLLVRHPEFEARYLARAPQIWAAMKDVRATTGLTQTDHANLARLFEKQRLCSLLLQKRWAVLRPTGGARFVTNDLGLAGYRDVENTTGYVVPLAPDLALQVEDAPGSKMIWTVDEWSIEQIPVRETWAERAHALNDIMAITAPQDVYSSTRQEATRLLTVMGPVVSPTPMPMLLEMRRSGLGADLDQIWINALAILGQTSEQLGADEVRFR